VMLGVVVAFAWVGAVPLLPAQEADVAAQEDTLSPEEQKRRAKEKRIADYLESKEQRRLEAESRSLAQETAPPAKAASEESATAAQATELATRAPSAAAEPQRYPSLPRELAAAQEAIRASHLARDPTIERHLILIDRSQASPQQLAAFANFLAESGMNRLALAYYEVAVRLEADDPVLWNNLGTIHRQLGEWEKAKRAFVRALKLNPANAMAHYNLGAVYDVQRKYDSAVREYRIALSLDPNLGELEFNPSAANNERLLAVKLLIYQEHAGNVGLPLSPMGDRIVSAPPLNTLDE